MSAAEELKHIGIRPIRSDDAEQAANRAMHRHRAAVPRCRAQVLVAISSTCG